MSLFTDHFHSFVFFQTLFLQKSQKKSLVRGKKIPSEKIIVTNDSERMGGKEESKTRLESSKGKETQVKRRRKKNEEKEGRRRKTRSRSERIEHQQQRNEDC